LLFGAMIGGSTNDLNENEYVSRDVEGIGESWAGSGGWIGCTMKRRDGYVAPRES